MNRTAFPWLLLIFVSNAVSLPPDTPAVATWVTDGIVDAIAGAGETVYIGGTFSAVGPPAGNGIPIDLASGIPVGTPPPIDNSVRCACPDGSGGWYIGGAFTKIGDCNRNHVARILSDGSVDTVWNPGAVVDLEVLAIEKAGSTVYFGGYSHSSGNNSIVAAFDTAAGTPIAWTPQVPSNVTTLQLSGPYIFAGMLAYWRSSGAPLSKIAAINATNGKILEWNPRIEGNITIIAEHGSYLYVGGLFTGVQGSARSYIARFGPYASVPVAQPTPVKASLSARPSITVSGRGDGPLTIRYTLPRPSRIVLRVYNQAGQTVMTPANAFRNAGEHVVSIPRNRLPGGVPDSHSWRSPTDYDESRIVSRLDITGRGRFGITAQ